MRIGRKWALAGVAALAAGCGGDGSRSEAEAAQQVADLAGRRAVASGFDPWGEATARPTGHDRRRALSTAAAEGGPRPAVQLLAFAERSFAAFFPGSPPEQTVGRMVYRHYPVSGAYLMVIDDAQVYVMGGPFGPQVIEVGQVGDFLRTVGGAVNGLAGEGLVLTLGGERLRVPLGSTSFRFGTLVPSGSAFTVAIADQPRGQQCTVSGGSGIVASRDVTSPVVTCPLPAAILAPPAPIPLSDASPDWGIDPSAISVAIESSPGGDGDGGAAGAAGDGAPLARSRVTLTDALGQVVSGLTDANGHFLLRFPTHRFVLPYVLRVVDAAGAVRVSVITEAIRPGTAVWTQINPLTDKIVSDSLRAGVGGTDKRFDGSAVDTARLAAARAELVAAIRPALASAGATDLSQFDPLRSKYRYDGSAVDAVIDSINHVRDPASGATQLRSKLATVVNNTLGSEVPRLVTSSAPLPGSLVAQPASGSLTHARLQAWIAEFNRCLALPSAAFAADVQCVDADGSRLVRRDFRANGKDFREAFRRLFSEFDGSPVSGSSLRNPSILFVDRSPGSPVDDLAIVQFTVLQPYIGPKGPDGPVGGAVEYPVVTVFRRDDTATRAQAGNWLLHGNQLRYDFAIEPRYYRFTQGNPARESTFPSYVHSSLRMLALRQRYDAARGGYVDADLRAVRVRGPGLPAAGIVLTPSTACGASTYLALNNKLGNVPATDATTALVQNDFRLASILADGSRFVVPGGYFPTRDITVNQIPYLTDFSPIRAYSVYRFEVFLRSNAGNSTPDAVENVRLLAPLMAPELALKLPMNDVRPSLPLITPGAAAIPAGAAAAANWANHPLAAPVGAASLYAEVADAARPGVTARFMNPRAPVAGAYALRAVPSSQLITVPTENDDANCAAGGMPAFDGAIGTYREVTLTSLQGQARVYSSMGWNR